jgi:hypothetical protein
MYLYTFGEIIILYMTRYYKIVPCLLAAAILLVASCKKNTEAVKTDNTAALSKQLALDVYKSLSSGVSTGDNKGLKTGSTSSLKTLSGPTCGESVITYTNRTDPPGSATWSFLGTSVFTYMCDGYYHNNLFLDAYILRDTLTVTAIVPDFKNISKTILYYVVKSTDANYNTLSVNGATSSDVTLLHVNTGGNVTQTDNTTVSYNWDNITVDRSGSGNKFTSGVVTYNMKVTTQNVTDNLNGTDNTFTGTITFLADNKIKTTMNNGTTTKTYITNVLTGETVEV